MQAADAGSGAGPLTRLARAPEALRVLYVEDDALDADLTQRALAAAQPPVQVQRVATVAEARERLSEGLRPDLLLVDMKLPDGNGMELLRVVRDAGLPLPVVMLTGSGDESTVVAALRGGADDYVVKSHVHLERLAERLHDACRRHHERADRHARPIQVLYAERTANDIDLLRRHLNRFAPHVLLQAVGSAHEVLQRLDSGTQDPPPDVLLLDFQLPGMNALELVKLLRQERGLDLPIVVATGQGDEVSAVQTLKLGATDYLVKHDDWLTRLPVTLESAHFRVQLERERVALRESQSRFRQMAEAIGDVFFLMDRVARSTLYVSPAFERLWGAPVQRLYDDWLFWLRDIHPLDQKRVRSLVKSLDGAAFESEFRLLVRDDVRHVHLRSFPVLDADGVPIRRAGIVQDITERKRQEARIEHLAYHDALTGLPNRLLLMDRLALALAHAHRQQSQVALLFLDLDRFKNVNDTLGHLRGDELLRQVAARLSAALREEDTVARLGGDEFVVLLSPVEGVAAAAHVADKLMAALCEPFAIGERELHVNASLGVSLYPRDGQDADALLKYADTALYKAKEGGRNAYRFFSPEMDAEAHERLRLENELRRAVGRGELLLHYQPQMDLASGRITGLEALLRWQHPVDGLIPPQRFIGLAEDTGLIVELGDWVLNTACRQMRDWQAQGLCGLRVAVNLSARQLLRPGLDQAVQQALATSGLAAEALELEITESSMMQDPVQAQAWLRQLQVMGVQLSIDDFGTGYSSLAHLTRLPLQRLKIDGSFIAGLPGDRNSAAIVEAVVAMARQLGLLVLAEGVETVEQRAQLAQLGCQEMQGFLLARPMPAEQVPGWLAQHAYTPALADARPVSCDPRLS